MLKRKNLMAKALSWARVFRVALFAALTLAIFILGSATIELRNQLRGFQEEPSDNIHWNLTQLELDIFRFEFEAKLLTLQPENSLDELRTRFDLFYSRAESTIKGRMFSQLGLGELISPMNLRLQSFLDDVTPVIDSDDATLRAKLPEVLKIATALRQDMRAISVDLIAKYAAAADARRSEFSLLLQRAAWTGAAVLAALIVLLGLVLWLNRQMTRNVRQTKIISTRLAATVDTSLDAIIVAGRDGCVIDFNAAAERTFGYSREEVVGMPLHDLIVPVQFRAAHRAGMDRLNQTGEMRLANTGRIEIAALNKDGREFPIEMSLATSGDGEDMLFISYLRDISSRIADEKAVIAARDKALAAEQAKTNFMAVMSHEMRTPLNGVMASLEIAARNPMDGKQARFLKLAQSSAVQLLRHVNEVLDISKIDAGRLDLAEEDFDLGTLVQTLVASMVHLADQKLTTIEVHALSELPKLHGDSFRLGQIIQNFLSNAIKFTQQGQITIEFEPESQTEEGVVIELRVSDTGIGIAEEDQERVFDDFVMIDPSYVRNSEGTGLGLAISRRLAHVMGGEIGVESDLGQGSCFWMRIPFRWGTDSKEPVTVDLVAAQSSAQDILVVEDNATNRIVLEEMLVHLGHKVTVAHDGQEGLTRARQHRFDTILMDISMPKMDGLTATKFIRLEGKSKEARIIAVTAHSVSDSRESFKAAGMDGFLTKPISEVSLARVLAGHAEAVPTVNASHAILSAERVTQLTEAMGQAGVTRIFSHFCGDIPVILDRIQKAAADHKITDMLLASHEGAGSCAMVGASAMSNHFSLIETNCRNGDLVAAIELAGQTTKLWQSTRAQIINTLPE